MSSFLLPPSPSLSVFVSLSLSLCQINLDHHCSYFDVCVGSGNHRSFVLMLAVGSANLLSFACVAIGVDACAVSASTATSAAAAAAVAAGGPAPTAYADVNATLLASLSWAAARLVPCGPGEWSVAGLDNAVAAAAMAFAAWKSYSSCTTA
jgi:hypothetical protein